MAGPRCRSTRTAHRGIGVELRYEWNGDLRVSQMFRAWEALEAAATEKRQDLEARGWHSETALCDPPRQ